jgi:hypothetical protein
MMELTNELMAFSGNPTNINQSYLIFNIVVQSSNNLRIYRVNLEDAFVTEFLPVLNYPGADGAIFDNTAAVYVEKLNRIYIFGGLTITDGYLRYLDKIWHIDLPSPSPPVPSLNSANLPQGSYLIILLWLTSQY